MLSLHHGHQKCLRLWWSGGAQAWKAEEEDVLLNPRAYVRYGRRLPPIPFILMLLHCIAAKIGKRLRVCKVAQKQDSNISTPLKSRAYHMPFQFSKVPTATPRFIVVVIADTITKKQIGRQYEKDWRGAIFIVHRMLCRGHFVQRNLSSTESPVQLMIFIYLFFVLVLLYHELVHSRFWSGFFLWLRFQWNQKVDITNWSVIYKRSNCPVLWERNESIAWKSIALEQTSGRS